jgi:hypothetical protein
METATTNLAKSTTTEAAQSQSAATKSNTAEV